MELTPNHSSLHINIDGIHLYSNLSLTYISFDPALFCEGGGEEEVMA